MATFDVGGINVSGHDLIVVLVQPNFAWLDPQEQEQLRQQLEICALSSGLRGQVVAVWKEDQSIQVFWPSPLTSLSKTITVDQLLYCVSSELICLD